MPDDSSEQSVVPPSPLPPSAGERADSVQWIVASVFLLAGVISAAYSIGQPMLREIFSEAATGKPVKRAVGWSGLDREWGKHGKDENLGLRFVGFDARNPSHRNASQEVYFRGTYFLWPRRLYTARSDYVINSATELIAARQYPDGDWFLERGVTKVVTFVLLENGQVQIFLDVHQKPGGGGR